MNSFLLAEPGILGVRILPYEPLFEVKMSCLDIVLFPRLYIEDEYLEAASHSPMHGQIQGAVLSLRVEGELNW